MTFQSIHAGGATQFWAGVVDGPDVMPTLTAPSNGTSAILIWSGSSILARISVLTSVVAAAFTATMRLLVGGACQLL